MIYPATFEQKIGFDRLREQVAARCTMRAARERLAAEGFSTSAREIERRLALADEMRLLLDMEHDFPGGEYPDVDYIVAKLRVEGSFLDVEEVVTLRRALAAIGGIVSFIISREERYPALHARTRGVAAFPEIVQRIDGILDRFGQVKDNASPALQEIRRSIREREGQAAKRLQAVLSAAKGAGIVDADAQISIRDGKAVIPVSAGNKRKLNGFIHDESATGKTFYVEPVEVVEINNELRELEYAERREVVRILSVDTATGAVQTDTTPLPDLRPYVRSETVPTASTPGAVRADGQYGVAVRADATLTTVPATAAQLDRMTEAYAPLTPALLPYGVKKALTSAAGAASWWAQEKTEALWQLGADDRYYCKAEAGRKFSTGYTLPCATAGVLGGVKPGRGLTVSADGTLEVTAENLDTVLGFSLAEKLKRLERMMDMDGKLVYTGAGTAGKAATSLTVPETVDYIVVRMVAPTAENSTNQVAAAAEYGSTRIVRGGTAVAMVGGVSYDFSNGVKCSGAAPVRMSFAASGVLSIGAVRTDSSLSFEYPFNVEGYQYV